MTYAEFLNAITKKIAKTRISVHGQWRGQGFLLIDYTRKKKQRPDNMIEVFTD